MPIGYWDSSNNCYWDSGANQCSTLDSFGNGDYNGYTYYNGDLANGYFYSIPGSSYSNTYFISGSPTSLDSGGNGNWNGVYYISATATSLDSCGNGYWNSSYYVGGTVNTSAYSSCANAWIYQGTAQSGVDNSGNGWSMTSNQYFVGGATTSLDSCGNGSWNSNYYVEGAVNESAYSSCASAWIWQGNSQSGVSSSGDGWSTTSNQYFIAGAATTLDSMGSGFWNSYAWYYGSQQANGWNGYYYYLNHQQTTLDSSGNGTWNGGTYVNGVLQVIGTKFVYAGDWNSLGNWQDDAGNPATMLPDGFSPITVVANVTSNSGANPTVPALTVDGASFDIYIDVGGAGSGKAVFKNGASLNGTIYGDADFRSGSYVNSGDVTGTATFFDNSYVGSMSNALGTVVMKDSSYMQSGSSVQNATFMGNSYNANDISGSVVAAHGGGINGSNILGFA